MADKEKFGFAVEHGEGAESGVGVGNSKNPNTGMIEALARNIARAKLWVWMNAEHPEEAELLSDQKKMNRALDLIVSEQGELEEEGVFDKVNKALGFKKKAETDTGSLGWEEILKKLSINEEENADIIKILDGIERGDKKRLDNEELEKVNTFLKDLLESHGPEGLHEVAGGVGLMVVEEKLTQVRAFLDVSRAHGQREVMGGRTAVAKYEEVIDDRGEKRLLQPRRGSKKSKNELEQEITNFTDVAKNATKEDDIDKLSAEKLADGFASANALRQKVHLMVDRNVTSEDRDKIYQLTATVEATYAKAIARKLREVYAGKKLDLSEAEVEHALNGLLRERKSMTSSAVELPGWGELEKEVERRAKLASSRRGVGVVAEEPKWEPSDEAFEQKQRQGRWAQELEEVMGSEGENKYNLFEDYDFFDDLARGEEGIKAIVNRAKPRDEARFREFLNRIRGSKEAPRIDLSGTGYDPGARLRERTGDTQEFMRDLNQLLHGKRYGEAANIMLEYITRVGIQESHQDWEFALIKRDFANALSKVSPDFKEAFDLNMRLGYLADMNSQKKETYYETALQIFGKGKQELTMGGVSLVSGNRVTTEDGKSVVFSMRTVKAILRNPRYMLKVLSADPNSMDSTLQNIMLEVMYGKGAHLESKKVDGLVDMYLALPGVSEDEWKKLSEINVGVQFAEVVKTGFGKWEEEGQAMNLEEMLQRNQWILRNGLGLMWYSGDWKWMSATKSYQDAVLQAAPKTMLTSDAAKAAYQANFQNVCAPMMRMAKVVAGILGPMPVYKSDNIVTQYLQDELQKRAGTDRGRGKDIADLFIKFYRQDRNEDVNGDQLTFFSRLRDPRMAAIAFNDWEYNNSGVGEILRERLEDMKFKGVPEQAELLGLYDKFLQLESGSLTISDKEELKKVRYFGRMYDGVWNEVKEMKLGGLSSVWSNMTEGELKALINMNLEYSGESIDWKQLKSIEAMKAYLLSNLQIDAMQNPTQTKHGDDWEQYYVKYSQARDKTLEVAFAQFATILGAKKHVMELDQSMAMYLDPKTRRDFNTLMLHDLNRATSHQSALAPLEIPLTTSREHRHKWWEFWKGEHEEMQGSSEFVWDKYSDKNGRTYYAIDEYGDRAYQTEEYVGNWAAKELDDDNWRTHDFEDIGKAFREIRLLDEHSEHIFLQRVLGLKKEGRALVGKVGKRFGMSDEQVNKLGDMLGGMSTKGWLLLTKLFLFDDPKYAFFSLLHEVTGMGWKTLEQIFGFSFAGGGGGHH